MHRLSFFQHGVDVIKLGLKLCNARELHSQSTLHIFKLLGDSDDDAAELGNDLTVLPGRASGTPLTTGTTKATGPLCLRRPQGLLAGDCLSSERQRPRGERR